jgi:transglutaminase-like putative cysteine protease
MVRLEFSIALRYQVITPSDFVFNLHAAQTAAQQVVSENLWSNVPVAPAICMDPHFGNRLMRLKAVTGEVDVQYRATVDIRHFLADPTTIGEVPIAELPAEVMPYILPSRYCQSDRISTVAIWEFGHLPTGYSRVEAVRRWVQQRTCFAPGTSSAITSAMDTLTEQRGVCRDFAHLMIALCRALNIPARFVTGIDYGADPALGPVDFHAYVEAYLGDRWYLFDPTDISPTPGLLRIGTGRDAADVSIATIFGDVRCGAPTISIKAIVDPDRGYLEPLRTTSAVSTADAAMEGPALRLVSSIPAPVSCGPADAALVPGRLFG